MSDFHFKPEWLYSIIAAVGGAARYLNLYLTTGQFLWPYFLANVLISGFSGLMFALMGKSMNMPIEFLYVCAGVGGFMGTNTLEWLAAIIQKRFKL